jgi:MFS family permease
MSAAIVVLLVLTWGGIRFAWRSPEILSMIAAALVLTGAFLWHARRTAEPFLPLSLMSGTVVPFAMTIGSLTLGTTIGLTVYLPLYYEVVYGLAASQAGVALIPLVAVSVVGSTAVGRVMSRMHHYKWVAIAGMAIATVMFAAIAVFTPLPLWLFLTLLATGSLGLGTGFPTSTVALQNAVQRYQVGTATGAANFFRSMTSSFTVAAFTAILLAVLGTRVALNGHAVDITHDLSAADTVVAFRPIFAAAALMMALACLAVILMEERPLAGPPDTDAVAVE